MAPGDTDVTQYAWDNRGRLVEVVQRETFGGDPTQVVDYLYDVENRWIGEAIDFDGDGLVDRQLRFVYDGTQIVLQFETEGEGAVTGEDLSHRYLWQANAVDQLLADEQLLPSPASGRGAGGEGDPTTGDSTTAYDQSTPGQVLWPLTDHLGTVRDLAAYDAETDTTAVANHIVYDAYGRVQSETNAAVDCLFAFTGRALDPATGLQNNWHRWYDAEVGRWISEDPIGFEGRDANLYRYVGNSPTNVTDPSGKMPYIPSPPFGWPGMSEPSYTPEKALVDLVHNATLKPIPRAMWGDVIEKELRFRLGYHVAAYLLEYSLQDNPADLVFSRTSFVSKAIAASSEYQAAKKQILDSLAPGTTKTDSVSVVFNQGDLFAAFHKTTMVYSASKDANGNVTFHATIRDRYDFDLEVRAYYGRYGKKWLAVIANNMAWSDQYFGVINNYDIEATIE